MSVNSRCSVLMVSWFAWWRSGAALTFALGLAVSAWVGPVAWTDSLAGTPAAESRSAAADDGVKPGERSRALALASAEQVEKEAAKQFDALKREAADKKALAPSDHPQAQRLRRIARDLVAFAPRVNERASQWRWEVVLIGSRQINAFCMPGGKIAFFTGILDGLKLDDDEVAMVMGHEIAHALLEHGRERVGKARAAQVVTIGASIASQLMGFGDLGGHLASGAAKLTMLKYGRDDETEADLIGMDLAARAGYDPRAAVSLWQKMAAGQAPAGGSAQGGSTQGGSTQGGATRSAAQPPEWLSTHPSHDRRIDEIRGKLDKVLPLFARARGFAPDQLPPRGQMPPRPLSAAPPTSAGAASAR
jgi:Zn-dependent protease with chaperone function